MSAFQLAGDVAEWEFHSMKSEAAANACTHKQDVQFQPSRITNVDSLPDAEWRKIYGQPDEFDAITDEQLKKSQSAL